MGLVKTRRLAAMRQKERAKMARGNVKMCKYPIPITNTNLKGNERSKG